MRLCHALILCGAVCTPPATAVAAGQEIPQERRAEADRAAATGRLLYAYDQAAWHGTDDFLAKVKNPEKLAGGYIADGSPEAPTLIFFDQDEATPHKIYTARFEGTRLISSKLVDDPAERMMTPAQVRMIDALRRVRAALPTAKDVRSCNAGPFNTIVLPPATAEAPVSVYLLTPQVNDGELPFGGHFVTEVAADGKVGPFRRFANSCLALPRRPQPNRGKPAMAFITYPLGPVPSEIHSFMSFYLDAPLGVGTQIKDNSNDMSLWILANGHVATARIVTAKSR